MCPPLNRPFWVSTNNISSFDYVCYLLITVSWQDLAGFNKDYFDFRWSVCPARCCQHMKLLSSQMKHLGGSNWGGWVVLVRRASVEFYYATQEELAFLNLFYRRLIQNLTSWGSYLEIKKLQDIYEPCWLIIMIATHTIFTNNSRQSTGVSDVDYNFMSICCCCLCFPTDNFSFEGDCWMGMVRGYMLMRGYNVNYEFETAGMVVAKIMSYYC